MTDTLSRRLVPFLTFWRLVYIFICWILFRRIMVYVITIILCPFFMEEQVDFGLQFCIRDFESLMGLFYCWFGCWVSVFISYHYVAGNPTINKQGRCDKFIYLFFFNIHFYVNIMGYSHHHHHHVVPPARISLTISRHFSQSFIASGRSSGLHPVSSHSCCM